MATAPPVSAEQRRVGLRLAGLAAAAFLLGAPTSAPTRAASDLAYDVELYQYVGNGRGLSWGTMAVGLGTVAGLAGRSSGARAPWRAAAGWGFAVAVPLAEAARVLISEGFPEH